MFGIVCFIEHFPFPAMPPLDYVNREQENVVKPSFFTSGFQISLSGVSQSKKQTRTLNQPLLFVGPPRKVVAWRHTSVQ